MSLDRKALYRHLIAIAVMIGITSFYFYPALQGYVVNMGDIVQHAGMSKEIVDFRETIGGEPKWTDSMFGGMPAYHISTKYFGNLLSYVDVVKEIFPRPPYYFLVMMLSFYILMTLQGIRTELATIGAFAFAFSSFFIISTEAGHMSKVYAISFMPLVLAGVLQLAKKDFFLGGVIFAIGLSLQLEANHFQITYYTLIASAIFLLYYALQFIRNKEFLTVLKGAGVFVLAGLIGVATNASSLLTTYEYSKSTTRGKTELTISPEGGDNNIDKSGGLDRSYITNWSLGIQETLALFIPNAKGGATGRLQDAAPDALEEVSGQFKQYVGGQNAYWGNQPFTSGPVYVGATIFLLFLLGLATLNDKIKWPSLITVILFIMLAWGKHLMWFTDLFIDYVPMYNKFRTVTMALTVVELLMPLIAIIFLGKLISHEKFFEENKKKILITGGAFAGIVFLLLVTPDSFLTFISQAESASFLSQQQSNPSVSVQITQLIGELENARVSIFKADGFRSFLFIILAFAVVFLAGMKKLNPTLAISAFALLIVFDLLPVDKRFLNNEKARGKYVHWIKQEELRKPFPPSQVDLAILENEKKAIPDFNEKLQEWVKTINPSGEKLSNQDLQGSQFGVLNYNSHYRVLNLAENTYNSSRTAYFHKSVGGYHPAKLKRYQELIDFYINRRSGKLNQQVLNMLNAKYVIMPEQNGGLQINANANGAAWFVSDIQIVSDADSEITELGKIKTKNQVVIDKRFEADLEEVSKSFDPNSQINMVSYKPNELVYASSSQQNQLAVFSEIYYQPGWNAYIDNELVNHVRVNYVLRGLVVPSGEHTITFKFEPSSYELGEGISYASSGLLILLLIGTLFFREKLVAK